MKTHTRTFLLFVLLAVITNTVSAGKMNMSISHLGNRQSMIRLDSPANYLLLPVEESSQESTMSMIVDNRMVKTFTVRLAVTKIDYFVPVDLTGFAETNVLFHIHPVDDNAVCWKEIKMSDTFDAENREKFRPVYHFSPPWGWMNDPNGMVYKDGVYHLFYQYNPYGSKWGNMHWGHATTTDLVSWKHQPVAIEPDALGTIFSGSAVVDHDNTAGFGAGAIVAFYTSAGKTQTQSMAYSLDNGKTFIKYDRNPILVSDVPDFRDPKVIRHKESGKWIMVLAVGQEMQFYSSTDLKNWTYESSFGDGEGAHAGVWECPDLIELPVRGTNTKKWVLLCNINPGGPFGGSATQYFTGSFDGKTFTNESPGRTKWMDWGKDHYATVTWSNAPDNRTVALAWMSNWEYANDVPTKQFRSANSVPRDLQLYTKNGQTYLSSIPSPELLKLRETAQKKGSFRVNDTYEVDPVLANNTGTYEIEIKLQNKDADIIGFRLYNSKGEEVDMFYNLFDNTFSMDRRNSGQVNFSKSFATVTSAPVSGEKEYTLRLFIDKCSLEAFDGKGEFVMTNLVFPVEPYSRMCFYAKGGSYTVTSLTVYPLSLK